MARPFYPHEMTDDDLDTLLSQFFHDRPDYVVIDIGALPVVLLPFREEVERSDNPTWFSQHDVKSSESGG